MYYSYSGSCRYFVFVYINSLLFATRGLLQDLYTYRNITDLINQIATSVLFAMIPYSS